MIKVHEFNTRWCGQQVGIITDHRFFSLASRDRAEILSNYSWVECVGLSSGLPARAALSHCGFYHADSQVQFRINLRNVQPTTTGMKLRLLSYAEHPFELAPALMMPFLHERFYSIPGIDEASVTSRYEMWALDLMKLFPETCVAAYLDDIPQGWFLSHPTNTMIDLTLAVLKKGGVISGLDLYSSGAAHYARQGYKLGKAGFSVTNTAVHNIYASMGARFTEPREVWIYHHSKGPRDCG